MSAVPQPNIAAERKAFYDKIDKSNVAPLWEVLHSLITATPNTPCKPYLWQWSQVWPWIQEAGKLITAKEAERRVLVLENPGLRGRTRVTHSLYAGLQLILPGEVAPAHRHTQSALRFIVHGKGAYTAVDGEKVTMSPGDFIITPSWTWHDHGNPSSEPMVWLDGLDIAIVELLDAQFLERPGVESQQTTRTEGESFARFGNTMLPVDFKPKTKTSPLFWYPYERTREALAELAKAGDPHPCYGHKLKFTNPATGGWAIPTIGSFMQLLPKGFRGQTLPRDRLDLLLGRRGQGSDQGRGRVVRVRAEGPLRRAVVGAERAGGRRRDGALLVQRPAGAGSARPLPRAGGLSAVAGFAGDGERRVTRRIALALAGVLALYAAALVTLGPLPQDPAYHLFADIRTCLGFIPRAGDVLTNLAILAAGAYGLAMRPRMNVAPDERPAADLLILGAFLTAAGSAYYHWAPSNATLVWDRLPMMLAIPPILSLILADRVHPAYARRSLVPLTVFGVASVLWWTASEAMGYEDVRLYFMVRVLLVLAILLLVVFRPSRYTGTGWLVAALAGEAAMVTFERLDHQVFAATGGLASGHNIKHLFVGVALACVFTWLARRRLREPAGPVHG